ncbi:MAG: DNA polymerase domain-containing protein [Candidatus ainarchaeum sp.]|nr:DNA polymerase domain-containing protein [Candidatus ainarchaeum sp.]
MALEKETGILLDLDYENIGPDSAIQLFLRTKKGILEFFDLSFRPYFLLVPKESMGLEKTKKALLQIEFGEEKSRIFAVEEIEKSGKKTLKIVFRSTKALKEARETFRETREFEIREFDIPFARRYLLDTGLAPMASIEISFSEKNSRRIISEIKPAKAEEIELNIAAVDIETYSPGRFSNPEKDPILMISFAGKKDRLVFTTKKQLEKNLNCRIFENEKKMIEGFAEFVQKQKLDIIVSYNGDNFDFPYFKERARQLKTVFNIGFGNSPVIIKKKGLSDRSSRFKAMQHLDAFHMLRMLSRFGVVSIIKYDLESVVKRLYNYEKKKIFSQDINKIWETEKGLEELVNYNLEDSVFALRIAEDYLQLLVEFCGIVRQNIFDVSRASASLLVESLLIRKAFEMKELVPNRPSEASVSERIQKTFKGGYVKEPIAGLHENIAVLDFRSLHPSIIISHNISPETMNCGHKECMQGKNLAPDKDWFCEKKTGFLPIVLRDILGKRIEIKKELKKAKKLSAEFQKLNARQQALKILLNSHYGYLGFARSRWYSMECARAVTAWSRHYVREVIHKTEEAGFTALYGDSITAERFVTIKNPKGFIEVKNIEEFFEKNKKLLAIREEKEIVVPKGFEALSVNPKSLEAEWKPIKEIIRHKTAKKIFRVNQKFGETRVTEDHSVITKEKGILKEIKPAEMQGKEFFSPWHTPKAKEIKILDLAEELGRYSPKISYKGREKINKLRHDNEFVWFGWMDIKKPVKLKRFIKIGSKEFESMCRLLGAYIAEGSSSTIETTAKRSGASISSSNIEWLESLQQDYALLSNAKTCIIRSTKKERNLVYKNGGQEKRITYTDNTCKLQMMNGISAVFFKMFCGQKSHGKKLPNFIFNVQDKYKKILLEKMIEGDGSHAVNKRLGYSAEYIKNNFSYTTKSLGVISGLDLLLKQLSQKHSVYYRESKKCYSIKTCTKQNKRIMTKITPEEYSGFVYDLSVKDNNNFVDSCGQVLLHNTDSTFLEIPKNKSTEDVKKFVEKINLELPEAMDLEIDGFYRRGIFVTRREGKQAAKKRYALIDFEDKLKIVGFEYVRRDWARIARETQKEVLETVLKEGNPEKAVEIIRKKILELKAGKVPKTELVVLTQIQRPLDKYSSIGPHVAAAKKAVQKGKEIEIGSVVGYIITRCGESISEKAQLEEFVKEGNYDADYYITHQLVPAVIRIIQELGYTTEDLLQGGKQQKLGAFQ